MQVSSPVQPPAFRSFRLPAPEPRPGLPRGVKLAVAAGVISAAMAGTIMLGTIRGPADSSAVGPETPSSPVAIVVPARVPLDLQPVVDLAPDSAPAPVAEVRVQAPVVETSPVPTEVASIPAAATETDPAPAAETAPSPPAATPAPRPDRWVVAGPNALNLRAAASTTSAVVATLPVGTVVEELPDSPGVEWRHVTWNGRQGWVSSSLVRAAP